MRFGKQPQYHKKNDEKAKEGMGWIKKGLGWGLLMYLIMTLLFPLIAGVELSWTRAITGIPIWALVGLGFGYTMKYVTKKS